MKTTLSSPSNERPSSCDNKSLSPSSSPRNSPRPSPRPQNKRDHSKSDSLLTVNYRGEPPTSSKHEGSPSSQEGSVSGRSGGTNLDISSLIDVKTESTSSNNKDKKDGRGKKKSSWFNSFYPTYKSKSEDFKKLFKEVPADERLVVDYSCALQKEILVQGRLYVTQNYLCFYANIFGWETNLILKWKAITAITKEKTALVIPNAVLICTTTDKYFFTSIVGRDKAYLMLFRVWQNALMDQPMSAQEMWQWVHQSYGAELGLTSDDEDYIAPGTEEDKLSARLSVESFIEENSSVVSEGLSEMASDEKEESYKVLSGTEKRLPSTDSHIPTDVTDNSESDTEIPLKTIQSSPQNVSLDSFQTNSFSRSPPYQITSHSDESTGEIIKSDLNIGCSSAHDGRQLLNEIIPIHIDQLFTLLFTSSKFFLDFHAVRKTTDLTQTPWIHNPLDNSKSRVVNSTVALTQAVGPKSTQVTETQVMLPCSKAGHLYAIDVETMNAGIPYADSFYVIVHYCLRKISDNQTALTIHAQIKYKKSVWGLVKGMIERNCWSGLEDFFNSLYKALHVESEECTTDVKRKSRRKRIRHALPRSCIEETRMNVQTRNKLPTYGIFSSDVATYIVFAVLILLLLLNVLLYYKLWTLEESPPYSLVDLQVLQNPPKSHEEWIKLLQQQESLHSVEAQKWQRVLKTSIQLLRQVEESLNELQRSIHPSYTNKVMSVVNNEADVLADQTEKDL